MRAADLHRLTCMSQVDSLGCMTCFWMRSSMRAADLHRLTCMSRIDSLLHDLLLAEVVNASC